MTLGILHDELGEETIPDFGQIAEAAYMEAAPARGSRGLSFWSAAANAVLEAAAPLFWRAAMLRAWRKHGDGKTFEEWTAGV